jgi:tetratricopeptide (TPR) repeat protein
VSWGKIVIGAVLCLSTLYPLELSKEEKKIFTKMSEDSLIISAIFYQTREDYLFSQKHYSYLYTKTLNREYLYKEVANSIFTNIDVEQNILKMEKFKSQYPNDLEPKRLLISLYINVQEYQKSKRISTELVEYSQTQHDLEFAANPYIYLQEYRAAIKLLDRAYSKNFDESILFRTVAILIVNEQDYEGAIKRLETHRRMVESSQEVLKYLINLYASVDDVDNLLQVYTEYYLQNGLKEHRDNIIEIYIAVPDYKGAIKFLEKYADDASSYEKLFNIYKEVKSYKKAMHLAKKLYKEYKDPKWYAEMGILTFEKASDKKNKRMLAQVAEYFEKALKLGMKESIYLNYYGFTLIDEDMNIERGIELIKQALKNEPKNAYYLDSLAWGYYKNRECVKAYDIIKQVIDEYGEFEDEIKIHYDKIKNCKKL